ncbi:MAG: ABC transporter ATP-binding protein [Desulfotalea sp.]|nr:MAG: ABC transporter ATP-binding protein [Desulfotalea sp.]
MISLEDLSFSHGDGGDIFKNFNLTIEPGESWTVIGPSGCGKTTLLFLVAGLKKPLGGIVRVGGEKIQRPRPSTGLVLQDHGLLPWATIYENTRLGLKIRHYYGADGKHSPVDVEFDREKEEDRVHHWLSWLGIDHLKDMYPSQLSRGQRQRAAIARTLVLEPDLLLMDEPFSALDAPIREELQKVMNSFHKQSRLTSLTVTHDIEEAVVLGEKILVLSESCNSQAQVIDNHLFAAMDERNSPEFRKKCAQLHEILSGQRQISRGALQKGGRG